MNCQPARARSNWREFAFLLHGLRQAVLPVLGLSEMAKNWARIVEGLSEPPRRRRSQAEAFAQGAATTS